MAPNTYSPYNYSYQQSSAQQYPGYQTAPPANNYPQPSRQYQPGLATTQAPEYMPYQAQSYGSHTNTYSTTQDKSWVGSSRGGNQDTSQAAEALHNMSNAPYPPPNSKTIDHAAAQRYSSNAPQAHSRQTPKAQATPSTYGQSRSRPQSESVSREQAASSRGFPSPATAAGYPSQQASPAFTQQPQRFVPPTQAQTHSSHTSQRSVPARTVATVATTSQAGKDFTNRQLPIPDTTHSGAGNAPSSYDYNPTQSSSIPLQSSANNAAETYNQGASTVDPTAVYDPWPEYQRKQEAIRARRAVEDAARADEERRAEEVRKEEEERREEEQTQLRKEMSQQTKQNKQKQKNPKQKTSEVQPSTSAEATPLGSEGGIEGGNLESEIRALMAKMREYNTKDPAMLARIWEEERRAKAPTAHAKPAPQAAPLQPTQLDVQQAANQREEGPATSEASVAATGKPAKLPTAARVARFSVPSAVPAATPLTRVGGTTIWPPEKKTILASAAVTYLNGRNPQMPMHADQIRGILDKNPSYIELCEQLEHTGITLDRAAFAKTLLAAVPDVHASSRAKVAQVPDLGAVTPLPVAPPAVMKRDIRTPTTPNVNRPRVAPPSSRPSISTSRIPGISMAAPIAEMVPINPDLKRPANKEEAARKRDFGDLIDLTQASEDDFEPPPKRAAVASISSLASSGHILSRNMDLDNDAHAFIPTHDEAQFSANHQPMTSTLHAREMRNLDIVQSLDRKKALRRNTYNIKTIARDVLLACGRHPEQRQLNQHLEVLRSTLTQVQQDADLSSLRWDLIDPGSPPRGYFKDNAQALAEDADDDTSDEEEHKRAMKSSGSASHPKVQAPPLDEAINPFKRHRRVGRPRRKSFGPDQDIDPSTPTRPATATMSVSEPRAAAAGVGYSAFRAATQYDANGNPIPKKRGRPVGWRKNIHGSAQAQAQSGANNHTGTQPSPSMAAQPSATRNPIPGINEPIRVDSRSPSIPDISNRYQSFKCKWQGCKAELHNLETLRKHVSRVHRNSINDSGFIECRWENCAQEVTGQDAFTGMRVKQHRSSSFTTIVNWTRHLEQAHFGPLSWALGDGPASGVSDATDSEAYLSDAHGRRVTPKLSPRPEYLAAIHVDAYVDSVGTAEPSASRGRGRPSKHNLEQRAMDVQMQWAMRKKHTGGPGMDRGGATLVNEKRRRGFIEIDDLEEQFVDVEDGAWKD